MHWIEKFSYQTYYKDLFKDPVYPGEENLAKARKEIEDRLGGKIKSIREIEQSRTGGSTFVICEALVELP